MEYFPWKKEYELGIPSIDQQHMTLVNLIDGLMMSSKTGSDLNSEEIIKTLKTYIQIHFKYEEELFEYYGWEKDKAEEHKNEHQAFINNVESFFIKFTEGKADINEEVDEFLKVWLYKHILIEDKKYVEFFKEKGCK